VSLHSEQPVQNGNRFRGRRPILYAIALVFVVLLLFLMWFYAASRPVPSTSKNVEVVIQSGESARQVASDLEAKGLIRSAFVFQTYLWWSGDARNLEAGRYLVRQGTGIEEIAAILANGRVSQKIETVVIPEGFTVRQIAKRLEDEHVCSAGAFIRAVQLDTYSEPFLGDIRHDRNVKYRLEGYLFPATYEFVQNTPAHQVVDEMLQVFQERFDAELAPLMKEQHISLTDVVTEASLIEKEAKVNAERPIIASVIQNRLTRRPPMKLQIDATIEYIVGYKPVLTDRDLRVNDPYNTYEHVGLPPGPICNPGMASLKAVLQPAKTSYLFYVVKNDKSGEHYFATTFSQQLANERKSQANLFRETHP
jgi:UPF0755 protein